MILPAFAIEFSSLEQHQTVALSVMDMSSVISNIPGAEIELNSKSLLTIGYSLQLILQVQLQLSRLPQKGPEELSSVFSASEEQWLLLSPSIISHSSTKIHIQNQISFPVFSVSHET